jgi:hypothetical protein
LERISVRDHGIRGTEGGFVILKPTLGYEIERMLFKDRKA